MSQNTRYRFVVILSAVLISVAVFLVAHRYFINSTRMMDYFRSDVRQTRGININSAVAASVARFLLLNSTKERRSEADVADLVFGDTVFWRHALEGASDGDRYKHGDEDTDKDKDASDEDQDEENEEEQEEDEEVEEYEDDDVFTLSTDKCDKTLKSPKRVYVIKHTESMEQAVPEWIELAFDKNGYYHRIDLNMPVILPKRRRHPQDVGLDPPISMTGQIQAWFIGYCLQQMGVTVSHVYSSPTLRCLETANTVLLGMGIDLKINAEPTLLEWFKWSEDIDVMNVDELRHFNINVNADYKPFIPYDKINFNESRLYEYKRCYELIKSICDRHKDEGGNILIIGHLSTMETIPRLISGGRPLELEQFISRVYEKPFGLMSVLEEDCDRENVWHKVLPPVQPLTWHAKIAPGTSPMIQFIQ